MPYVSVCDGAQCTAMILKRANMANMVIKIDDTLKLFFL
jgi:hypothetical protein